MKGEGFLLSLTKVFSILIIANGNSLLEGMRLLEQESSNDLLTAAVTFPGAGFPLY